MRRAGARSRGLVVAAGILAVTELGGMPVGRASGGGAEVTTADDGWGVIAPVGPATHPVTAAWDGEVTSLGPARATAPPPTPGPVDAPPVVARAAWDPQGTCPAVDAGRIQPQQIHLHHTHLPVVTHPDQVPDALRAICAVHRRRGFDDIGYHWAIDPWGTIWQARGPDLAAPDAPVGLGAHAQGFNHGSIGVVLIGDFDVVPPTPQALAALEQLLAHLAHRHGLDPEGNVATTSHGGPATRFEAGTTVMLPALAGHRDTGAGTACPGEHLYALLPRIRAGVAERLAAAG